MQVRSHRDINGFIQKIKDLLIHHISFFQHPHRNVVGNAAYHPSVMSQISHELRIPLTGIIGMAFFLGKTKLTPQQEEYLHDIQESAQRLLAFEGKLRVILKNKSK